MREARFAAAFTFQYSIRPGTPAATMPDQVPPEVVRERYERLVEVVNEIAWAENTTLLGSRVELLVAEGEGRKDAATHRMTGRARDNRLVHFAVPAAPVESRSGPATWSRSRSPTPRRTTWSPTDRPGPPAYPLRRRLGGAHRTRPTPSASACPPSAPRLRRALRLTDPVADGLRRPMYGASSLRGSFDG